MLTRFQQQELARVNAKRRLAYGGTPLGIRRAGVEVRCVACGDEFVARHRMAEPVCHREKCRYHRSPEKLVARNHAKAVKVKERRVES